jgi:hypothetical protein
MTSWSILMFTTYDAAEVTMPHAFRIEGSRDWMFVEKSTSSRWFLIRYETSKGRRRKVTDLFVSNPQDIVQIAELENSQILEVQIVTPGQLNNQGRWVMEPLKEIWLGLEPDIDHHQTATLFVTESGTRYTDSWLSTPPDALSDLKLLYRYRRARRRTPKPK